MHRFQMYNLMSFHKCIHWHNHYFSQGTEHFHYPLKFSPTFLQSICISCSPTHSQAFTLPVSASPKTSRRNHTACTLLCLNFFYLTCAMNFNAYMVINYFIIILFWVSLMGSEAEYFSMLFVQWILTLAAYAWAPT